MTTNASLTWYWTNVYQLVTTAAANGSMQVDRSAWYTNGTTVTMTAVPDSGYYFVRWSGDCPVGSDENNPLTVTMNQRRTLMAQFASSAGQTKVWSGTGNWYSNSVNWSPVGAPGTGDAVVVSSGTVTLTDPAVMASLTVSNTGVVQARGVLSRYDLVVAGSVNLAGASARLSVTNANLLVGGNLMVTNGAALLLASGPTNSTTPVYGGLLSVGGIIGVATTATIYVSSDPTNGGSFKMVTGALLLNGGKINANATGWQGGTASHTEGYGPGHGHPSTYGGGAGYGGDGGNNLSGGAKGFAYGVSNAPALPGSGGAYYSAPVTTGGCGGGLVWVETLGRVTLGGTITANGADGQPHAGAGSGGGIYIQCGYLSGDTSGWLIANGGGLPGANPGGGNGGGGRIAVKCGVLLWGSTNQVSVMGGTNGMQTHMYGQTGTIYWEITPPRGTMFMVF
jgi:hypothetical protein